MKKLTLVVSLLVGLGLAGSALAQTGVQSSHRRWDEGWQKFLNNHGNVKRDVNANPNVVLDPNYRRTHPELAQWLKTHPHERSYLYGNGGAAIAPHSWMSFLQNHPNYQQAYYQNPYQFADPAWVNQHPDLEDYYEHHPGVRDDLQDRGRWYRDHHDYDGWRWRNAWNDQDEDEDRDERWEHEHWEHHPPGHAYGWEKHHAHEEWEEHEAAERADWQRHEAAEHRDWQQHHEAEEHADWQHHDHGDHGPGFADRGHGHGDHGPGHGHGHHDND